MSSRYKRRIWILFVVVILPFVVLGVWFNRQIRQQRLDHALIVAIKKLDTPEVISLLDQGADANATDKPFKQVTLESLLNDLRNKLQRSNSPTATRHYSSALMLVYGRVSFFDPGSAIIGSFMTDDLIPDEFERLNRHDPARLISALLDHGANLNDEKQEGETLLEYACVCSDAKTVKVLLDHHVNPNGVGRGGTPPPDYPPLIYTEDYECFRLLLEFGADANTHESGGRIRLMTVRNTSLYPLLLGHGTDPNAQDSEGCTALMNLVENLDLGNAGISNGTRYLIQHGAKVSVKDKAGQTALDYAKRTRTDGSMTDGFSLDRYDREVIRPLEEALKREQVEARK